jgi:hypothetical protein
MDPGLVAKTWISRGLYDLYFGFSIEEKNFSDYALFFEIMGLEKFLKAVHLYNRGSEYKEKDDEAAKICLDKIAKELGHDIKEILKKVKQDIGTSEINNIEKMKFDGYKGLDLIRVVNAGYIETRYPTPRLISDTFPIEGTSLTRVPLSGSGIKKFIYMLCNLAFQQLAKKENFSDVIIGFKLKFQHKESFKRFNNLFWESKCGVSL